MAKHYEHWLTEKIPALEGRTPLEAVRDDVGREKVRALVDGLEQAGRRGNPPLDEAIMPRLRERLGLD
jgi:hypothetical protein